METKYNLIAMYGCLDLTDPLPEHQSRMKGIHLTDRQLAPGSLALCQEHVRQGQLKVKSLLRASGECSYSLPGANLRLPCPFNETMQKVLEETEGHYVYWFLEKDSEEGSLLISEIFASNVLSYDESVEGWSDALVWERVNGFKSAVQAIFVRLFYSQAGYRPWITDPQDSFAGLTDAIFRGKSETNVARQFHDLFPLQLCRRHVIDTLYQGVGDTMMETPELFREEGLAEWPRTEEN